MTVGAAQRDGSLSGRGGSSARKMKATLAGSRPNEFLTLVERTADAFVQSDDSAVEDVRRILTDVRQQYDSIHSEAEKKESELQRLREAIRVADSTHGQKADEVTRAEDVRTQLE